mgnify:CR=1 FL=1
MSSKNYILFYRKNCQASRKILLTIKQRDIVNYFSFIDVDVENKPKTIKAIPAIVILNENKILYTENALDWIGYKEPIRPRVTGLVSKGNQTEKEDNLNQIASATQSIGMPLYHDETKPNKGFSFEELYNTPSIRTPDENNNKRKKE